MHPDVDPRIFVHRIDAADKLIFVNDAWLDFAVENAFPARPEGLLQQPLFDFIADRETRYLTRLLLDRVRSRGRPLVLPFRCDSPDKQRFMNMEIVPLPDGQVEFRCRVLRIVSRPWIALLDPGTARSADMVRMCSWCKKVDIDGRRWAEVEEAIQALDLFGGFPPPGITHTICSECQKRLEASEPDGDSESQM